MDYPIVIGIAGGTGSGKSTIIKKIKEQFNDAVTILSHDYYYKAHDDLTYEERTKLNYDHPDAFDTDLMVEHIKALKRGEFVERPSYDFSVHNRRKETVTVVPS